MPVAKLRRSTCRAIRQKPKFRTSETKMVCGKCGSPRDKIDVRLYACRTSLRCFGRWLGQIRTKHHKKIEQDEARNDNQKNHFRSALRSASGICRFRLLSPSVPAQQLF